MIGLATKVKKAFLSDHKVHEMRDRIAERGLKKIGAFVRRTAQQSIRVSSKPSLPGKPPKTRKNKFLKRFIKFHVNLKNRSVIIGPEALTQYRGMHIPKVVAYGGTVQKVSDSGNRYSVTVSSRPFMEPALMKNKGKIAEMFGNKAVTSV